MARDLFTHYAQRGLFDRVSWRCLWIEWKTHPPAFFNIAETKTPDPLCLSQRGECEDGIADNSDFEDGDWNGDGEFDTSDFVYVFQKGNYVAAATQQNIDALFLDLNEDELRSERKMQAFAC